jgi:hypothetical protein
MKKFLLMIFLIVSSGWGMFTAAAQVVGADAMQGWQLENGWTINRTAEGYEFIALGQGQATNEKTCQEGVLSLSFRLKKLTGLLNANININGSNRYTISFLNNGNGSLSTNLTKNTGIYGIAASLLSREVVAPRVSPVGAATARIPPERIQGQNVPYVPYQEYLIKVTSYAGQILVTYQLGRSEPQTVINYLDENPLPFGKTGFDTPRDINITNEVQIYDVRVVCPLQNMEPPSLGIGYFKRPTRDTLISTPWGDVPANQVLVVVNNTANFQEAQAIVGTLAADLGGSVVGEFEIINLFQIETRSEDLAGLMDNLFISKNYPSIQLAFPNEQVFLETNPLDDMVYSNGGSEGYNLVGAKDAWDLVKGLELCDVLVGVTDDGLFRGYGEFNGSIEINTTAPYSNLTDSVKGFKEVGSHGTGVMNLLAADPDNAGIVGIASEPLRARLKVTMINIFPDSHAYVTDSLLGLKQEIEDGCTIFSCSWGDSNAHEDTVSAYNDFFYAMYDYYPCLLFVCSAGNEGKKLDGSKRIPNGKKLPNIITVGNVLNDGKLVESSNRESNNFEVTLAAPGQNAVWGWDGKTIIHNLGGTSMATPHVTAAAAIIRSMRPDLSAKEIKNILSTNMKTGSSELGGILDIYASANAAIGESCESCQNCTAIVKKEIEVPDGGSAKPETPVAQEYGFVEGRIFNNKNGAGVASAEMTYRRMPDREEIMTGIMTDSLGNYRLKLLPGKYQIGVQASGYGRDKVWAVDVYRGQTKELNLGIIKGI